MNRPSDWWWLAESCIPYCRDMRQVLWEVDIRQLLVVARGAAGDPDSCWATRMRDAEKKWIVKREMQKFVKHEDPTAPHPVNSEQQPGGI